MPLNRILLVLLAGSSLLPAQSAAPAATGLDPRVQALVEEARKLQQQQNSYEALRKLDEADAISPGSAYIANIRGSIYTAPPLRDFAKARECFDAAEKYKPDSFEPKFNKNELLFVERKYAESEAAFAKLLADFPKLREEVRHLVQFKIIVSQLKQDKTAEAEKSSSTFTFMDDTPAFYYTKAAFAYHKGDAETARNWISKAQRIFKPQENAVYIDTFMEAGWLTSLTAGGGTN